MIRLLPLVLVILVLAMFGGCQQTRSTGGVTRSSAVPDFVQEGKVYTFDFGHADRKVRVLKIRSDGWVQAQRLEVGDVRWYNISHVEAVKEVEQ
jgi:hypothetical protein